MSRTGLRGDRIEWERGRKQIKGIEKQLGSRVSLDWGSDEQMNFRTGQNEDAGSKDVGQRLKGLFNKELTILHHS